MTLWHCDTAVLTLMIALFYSPIKYWLELTASRSWWNKNQMSNRNRCPSIRSTERSDVQFLINFLKKYTATTAERSCCLSRNCLELNIKHHTVFTKNILIIKKKKVKFSLFCSRLDHGLKYQMFSPGDAEKVDNLKRTSPNSFQIVLC